MCVRYDLERSAPLSFSTVCGVIWSLTRPARPVSVGNVQSRPKGDSSLGILFENPLKLHTHSLASTMYVQTVWTTPIVVDFGLLET